jgi:hypothetical protein
VSLFRKKTFFVRDGYRGVTVNNHHLKIMNGNERIKILELQKALKIGLLRKVQIFQETLYSLFLNVMDRKPVCSDFF